MRKFLIPLALLAFPFTARADAIDLPLVGGIGLGVGIPLIAFNVILEAWILGRIIRVRYADLWRPMLRANLVSFAVGLPVTILNAMLAEWILPSEMVARMATYPVALSFAALNYFLASVLTEYLVVRRRFRQDAPELMERPVGKGIWLGNLATYAVLGPLFVMWALPKQTVHFFAADTKWAATPLTQAVYVGPAGGLHAILTDGTRPQTLLTNEVRDFVVSEDLRTILFRGSSNHYFFAYAGETKRVTAEPITAYGQHMDFSPDGNFAAVLKNSDSVLVWERASGATRTLSLGGGGSGSYERVCWSTNDAVFYLFGSAAITRVTLESGLAAKVDAQMGFPGDLVTHYARLGSGKDHDREDWQVFETLSRSKEGNGSLMVLPGLSPIVLAHYGRNSLRISDNPGVFHLGRRLFREASFCLAAAEFLFDDGEHLYLANIRSGKVGLLVPGRRFLLLTEDYSKPADCRTWFR